MSRFFVGQRVRVKWFRYCRATPATEGVIRDIGRWEAETLHNELGMYFLEPAEAIVDLANGEIGAFLLDQLEPILDRHEPCESEFKESLDKLLSEVSREAV